MTGCPSSPANGPSAASWLLSTVDDYWAFVQMLLQHGGSVLSDHAVNLMTTDHLTREQRTAARLWLGSDGGWGSGMRTPAADVARDVHGEMPGGFGWDGGTGTTWRSNVDRDLTGILFTQRAMTSLEPPPAVVDFWNCVDALDDRWSTGRIGGGR